jgi:hypothetical protein
VADEALAAFKPWHPEFEHLAAVEAKAGVAVGDGDLAGCGCGGHFSLTANGRE